MPNVFFNDISQNKVEGIPIKYNDLTLYVHDDFLSEKKYFNKFSPYNYTFGSNVAPHGEYIIDEDNFSPLSVNYLYSTNNTDYGIFEQAMFFKKLDNFYKTDGKLLEDVEGKYENKIYNNYPAEELENLSFSLVSEDYIKDQFTTFNTNNIEELELQSQNNIIDLLTNNTEVRQCKTSLSTNKEVDYSSPISICEYINWNVIETTNLSGFINRRDSLIDGTYQFYPDQYLDNVWQYGPKFNTFSIAQNIFPTIDLTQEVYVLNNAIGEMKGLFMKIYNPEDKSDFYFKGFYGNEDFGDTKIIFKDGEWLFLPTNKLWEIIPEGNLEDGSLRFKFYIDGVLKKNYPFIKYTKYNFYIPHFYNTNQYPTIQNYNNYICWNSSPKTLILKSDYNEEDTYICVDPQSYSILI